MRKKHAPFTCTPNTHRPQQPTCCLTHIIPSSSSAASHTHRPQQPTCCLTHTPSPAAHLLPHTHTVPSSPPAASHTHRPQQPTCCLAHTPSPAAHLLPQSMQSRHLSAILRVELDVIPHRVGPEYPHHTMSRDQLLISNLLQHLLSIFKLLLCLGA